MDLFQLDRPVSVVEELLPTAVSLPAQMDMNKRIVRGLDGFCNEFNTGLFGCSAAFFYVAFGAGADYICPERFAPHTARDNVVK